LSESASPLRRQLLPIFTKYFTKIVKSTEKKQLLQANKERRHLAFCPRLPLPHGGGLHSRLSPKGSPFQRLERKFHGLEPTFRPMEPRNPRDTLMPALRCSPTGSGAGYNGENITVNIEAGANVTQN
jgi:hypothetical protein